MVLRAGDSGGGTEGSESLGVGHGWGVPGTVEVGAG
jgi:hypothetical protein